MLSGKVTVGSAPVIVLWSCSGIWWMCMEWAGAHSSVLPETSFILVADAIQPIDLGAVGNKSLSDLLDSATRLSDVNKENAVNVTHALKTDQYCDAVRNSKNRNGYILSRKTRISPIHATPYDSVTKNFVHFNTIHEKIGHFLKFMGSYGIGGKGFQKRGTFLVSHENKLDNISSLEQASMMDIGNSKQSMAVRSKYITFIDSTSETSFTNNSISRVNFYDVHTLSPKRMNHNMTVENTTIFRCSEYPVKKSNQMCIYDLDGNNCLVNTSKIHLVTPLHIQNSLPSANSSIHFSRSAPNVSYMVNESKNMNIDFKSDKGKDSEQKRINFSLNVASDQINSDIMKPALNSADPFGKKLEQIETDKYSEDNTLETLKNKAKTQSMDAHETYFLNKHGYDDVTGDDEDRDIRYKTLGRTIHLNNANRTGDPQHEAQENLRKNTARELRSSYSPKVMSSWNVKENINKGLPDLMNNVKLADKYWQPMWYNV